MSQDISTHQSTKEPVADSISLKPWSAEAYAEQLMDDLFSDIDRILEGGSKLPTEPAKPEYVSLQPVKIPQITMPPAVMSLGQVLAHQGETPNAEEPPEESDAPPPPAPSSSTPGRGMGQYFDKLLLGAVCGSVAVTLILWWASHERLNFPVWLNSAGNSAAQDTLTQSDAQFVNYMLRSLELIDRKALASRQQANPDETAAQPALVPSLPSQPSPERPSNPPQAANSMPTVVGILPGYYPQPQYQPPQVAPPAPRAAIPITPPAVNPIRPPAAIPISPPAAIPISPPAANAIRPPAASPIRLPAVGAISPLAASPISPPAATTVSPHPSQLPQPPVARQAVTPSATVAQTPQTPSPTPAPAEAKHTLVGLLYLGDRSAALFDISGVTQRIQVGEPIGASGWTLVSVTKDEAIIRRNGEVRSIYAGQKF